MTIAFDFAHYYILASIILENLELFSNRVSEESIYRSIVNRSYYASYNHTVQWLKRHHDIELRVFNPDTNRYENIEKKTVHKIAYSQLRKVSSKHNNKHFIMTAASKLEDLYDKRIIADYKDIEIISIEDAKDSIDEAKYIFKTLQ